jgi:large subunit ribosomal protein L22
MAYRASHKFARISATKVRGFADLVRGRKVAEGLNLLQFEPNRGAKMLFKVLQSAKANADDQGVRNSDALWITDCRVDGGPMFKRMMPRSRGMAFLIRRRFAHIHVEIDTFPVLS